MIELPSLMVGSERVLEICLGWCFIIGVASIMVSTIDSLLMGIAYTYAFDIDPNIGRHSKPGREKDGGVIFRSRVFTSIVVLALLGFLFLLNSFSESGGEKFISFLLTFYSVMVAFVPLVLGILFIKLRPNKGWALSSMLGGSISGLGVGMYSIFVDDRFAWYPVTLSIVVSSMIFGCGCIATRKAGGGGR